MSDSSDKMHVTDGSFAIGNTQQHIDNQTIENQVVNNYLTQPQSDEKKPERIITCGDYDKALEHYKKALVIVEKVLDPEHPSTAATYNNIALRAIMTRLWNIQKRSGNQRSGAGSKSS